MGAGRSATEGPPAGGKAPHLTERQQKWFASVQAGLERDTGRSVEDWVAIARACPHDRPKARTDWLREQHGLGVNRASLVLSLAFPATLGWDEPEKLRAALWTDPAGEAILQRLEAAIAALPDVSTGQRKGFTAFSRKVQLAAARPAKDGQAMLGLAVDVDAHPRLQPRGSEGWSERLTSKLLLKTPEDVDGAVESLLRRAWEAS
jgi:hypothetical protein